MNGIQSFLLFVLARFRVLSVSQMVRICNGRAAQPTVYRAIKKLRERGLVMRVSHPMEPMICYTPTEEGHALVYREQDVEFPAFKLRELSHIAACATVFMALARRVNVTGFALEHELSTKAIDRFCHSRIPDGIVEVAMGTSRVELAIEVEISRKPTDEIQSIISNYRKTFEFEMPCGAVLIVAPNKGVFDRYKAETENLSQEIESRVVLIPDLELSTLNASIYGSDENRFRKSLEKLRAYYQGRAEYVPILSTSCLGEGLTQTPTCREGIA